MVGDFEKTCRAELLSYTGGDIWEWTIIASRKGVLSNTKALVSFRLDAYSTSLYKISVPSFLVLA